MMMALIILMMALAIHSLFLPGGSEGLKFYLLPDIRRMRDVGVGNVIVGAMNQTDLPSTLRRTFPRSMVRLSSAR